MRKVIFLLLLLLLSNIIYSQWTYQNSGTGRNLFGLEMLNENTGFICGSMIGAILRTSNSGLNWVKINEPTGDQYNDIAFCDGDTGIAVGPPNWIIRTTNGGNSWFLTFSNCNALGSVNFVNKYLVYTCGRQWIYRSTNCGLSWTQLGWWPYTIFKRIQFTDTLNGMAVGTEGYMLSTTNGGINWAQRYMMLPVQFGDSSLYDLTFINQNTGFACGNNGIFIKTTNAGVNWTYYSNGNLNTLQGVYFLNEYTGYTVGSAGRINKTTNGGINWTLQNSGTNTPLWDVYFINENTGWICGFNGTILKTTNGGSTWIQPINSEMPKDYKLEQNFPNPFNPSTNIKFSIPKNGLVNLTVYDMLGKEISVLVNEKMGAGNYEVSFDGSSKPSGVYLYKLEVNGISETKRMLMIK